MCGNIEKARQRKGVVERERATTAYMDVMFIHNKFIYIICAHIGWSGFRTQTTKNIRFSRTVFSAIHSCLNSCNYEMPAKGGKWLVAVGCVGAEMVIV